MDTLRCVVCLKPVAFWTGHVRHGRRAVAAGFCSHEHSHDYKNGSKDWTPAMGLRTMYTSGRMKSLSNPDCEIENCAICAHETALLQRRGAMPKPDKKPEWRDTTSHGRDTPTEERTPRVYEFEDGPFRIIVHKLHGASPADWYLTVFGSVHLFKDYCLGDVSADEAKSRALKLVEKRVEELYARTKRWELK